ncbi:hypothetical protein BUALT_Bualt01G0027000 [Buddleja alternifolia]|uniref:Demeter RRM-fold domain-containing protein n=1 Tax=Buddleja alternifolia TaxID=168488 RepID=A0AAV6Y828_9LAMI|nr:hypothetical protein BUALT_Bualt01G0027000 [Buddleja alternifolia]
MHFSVKMGKISREKKGSTNIDAPETPARVESSSQRNSRRQQGKRKRHIKNEDGDRLAKVVKMLEIGNLTNETSDDVVRGEVKCFDLVYHRKKNNKQGFQQKLTNEMANDVVRDEVKRFGIVYHRKKNIKHVLLEKKSNKKGEKKKHKGKIVVYKVIGESDRKFSQWKGSVIDSVGGAYLTQNVNDTLSSSAFMMLAAKYPSSTATQNISSSSKIENGKPRKNKTKIRSYKKDKDTSAPGKRVNKKDEAKNWDNLKRSYYKIDSRRKCSYDTSSALDWDAVSMAQVEQIAKAIVNRGMSNNLASRIKNCLTIFDQQLGSVDLEWMRDVPPHIAKNAGRVAVRLGWVPLQPLPQGQEFHLLKEYELHCHMITCGKVFCTKANPNCNACPMNAECKHYASALASAEQKSLEKVSFLEYNSRTSEMNIEDLGLDKIRRIIKKKIPLEKGGMSTRVPKLKNITHLRTEHQVYEIRDRCRLLEELQLEKRELNDPCQYLLAIWTLGNGECIVEDEDIISATLLIPIRTAMRGTFPLNGTYFQVNEVLADAESSEVPIKVHRATISHLPRKTLYCGNNISAICRGMKSQEVQKCFSEGYVCFRGFDTKTREPKPLSPRFHLPPSKVQKQRNWKLKQMVA